MNILIEIRNCIQENFATGDPIAIVPNKTVEEIIHKYHPVTIVENGDIMYYKDGKYVGNGFQVISHDLAKTLGPLTNEKGKSLYNKKVKEEIFSLLRDKTYIQFSQGSNCSFDEFDSNLDLINMKNGFFNWRTKEFFPHNENSHITLSRIQVPIEYNPDATCELLEEILRDIIQPHDYIKMLEFIAYLFYRKYEIQKAFILFGEGSTGKSAFLNMIDHMIGIENCSAVPFAEIDRPFSRATLCGKSINKCGELDSMAIKRTDVFKNVTSGMDLLQAENKYCPPFWFISFAKIIWGTNSLPKVFDDTSGFYRRIIIIPFLRKFRPEEYDQKRMDAMVDPHQLSGLFNKCIALLKPLLERHDFTNSDTVDTIREMYRAASDPFATFIADRIIPLPEGIVPYNTMYETYLEYCKNYRANAMDMNSFNKKFSSSVQNARSSTRPFGRKKMYVWEGIDIV